MSYLEKLELTLEWRDIEGYEGIYKISEYGDIMSFKNGKKKILKPNKNNKGYLLINLCKNGEVNRYLVHRLVAIAFCENTNCYNVVNHMDENPLNNHYSNLEWCTQQYNLNYGTRNERAAESKKIKVKCIELNMIFDSVTEAAKYIYGNKSHIAQCCKGNRKTHRGYHWEYVD